MRTAAQGTRWLTEASDMPGLPTTSLVIPTYNRPVDLEICLRSVLTQTVLPQEVLIIDDGALETVPLRNELEAAGISAIYYRKDTPGLTESRNKGIDLASGEIIFFLDDDTELFPEYFQAILEAYDDPAVMGVGALIANLKPMTPARLLRWAIDVIFLNRGFRAGNVLPSGFCTDFGETPFRVRTLRETDFQDGCAASYRCKVFEELRFTDGYRSWGLGEDKDFSYQVAKRHRMLIQPQALLNHYESPTMRPDKRAWGRKFVLGRWLFFRDHVRTAAWQGVFFWYAIIGYLAVRTVIAAVRLRRDEWQRVLGILEAARDIALGRVTFNTEP